VLRTTTCVYIASKPYDFGLIHCVHTGAERQGEIFCYSLAGIQANSDRIPHCGGGFCGCSLMKKASADYEVYLYECGCLMGGY
jgi:hypothetical protein